MAELTYTTRGVRQRGQKDSWEITFSHKDPITGEAVRTYHTVEAKTRRQALRKRDELVLELEHKGGALATGMTMREFMDRFLDYKEKSGTIEPSTVRGYRGGVQAHHPLPGGREARLGGHRHGERLDGGHDRGWLRPQDLREGLPLLQAGAQVGGGLGPHHQEPLRLLQAAQSREDAHPRPPPI